MILNTVTLKNFRNYDQKTFSFSPRINLILGPNGVGKSNLLEAIYLLAHGKSFRAQRITQLIRWGQPLASVRGKVVKEEEKDLEVQLTFGEILGKKTLKRRFLVGRNLKPRRLYLGQLKSVLFSPEDIRVVTGSPSRRRDFLDLILSQLSWEYARSLSQYKKALTQRNRLLDQIRDGYASPKELFFWDQSLTKNSDLLIARRQEFFTYANRFFGTQDLIGLSHLSLSYRPHPITRKILAVTYRRDLRFGSTSTGPHRDDFSILDSRVPQKDKNLAYWGSRGQQRLGILGLKLAEIDYLAHRSGEKPILLLDDIFSELDENHQKVVVDLIHTHQTFITSADPDIKKNLPQARFINLV